MRLLIGSGLVGIVCLFWALFTVNYVQADPQDQDGGLMAESRLIEQQMLESMRLEPLTYGWIILFQDKIYSHIYNGNSIRGISDSGHGHGKYNTIIFYNDKNGKKKMAQSDSPSIAQVAGEIKGMWARGFTGYQITFITDAAGGKIQSLTLTMAKPEPKK